MFSLIPYSKCLSQSNLITYSKVGVNKKTFSDKFPSRYGYTAESKDCAQTGIGYYSGYLNFMLDLYDENTALLRMVAHINRNIVKVKDGESINAYTQFMRQMQDESNKKVFGLKIDLRFVVTIAGVDMDVGSLEAANELPANKKVLEDAGKLLVEAKDTVDGLLNAIHDITDVREISGAGIQVGGLAGQTFSMHIYKPKTYVAVPDAKLDIPSNIRSLASFTETFGALMTLIVNMENIAVLAVNSNEFFKDRRRSFGKNFNTTSSSEVELDYVRWVTPSWYPPVNNQIKDSKVPVEEAASSPLPFAIPKNSKVDYDADLVDQYRWVFLGDRYYNIETNVFEDEHPIANHDDQVK